MKDAKAGLYAEDLSVAKWHKASASAGENDCVEIAELPHGARAIRDSKNPKREPLRFAAPEWDAFRAGVIAGEL